MKVALVHDFLKEFGGAEKVLLDLIKIYPGAPIYTLFYNKQKLGRYFKNKKIVTSSLQTYYSLFKKKDFLLRPLLPKAIEEFDFQKYDLVISNTNSFAKGVITGPDTLHISYCHSPTRYLWDYAHQYEKEHKIRGLKGLITRLIFSNLRLWDLSASKRPDFFLANSKNVARRIKKYYRREAEIIYPGIKVNDFKISSQKKRYFLIVSRLSRYKKTDLAIQTFKKLPDKLLIVGRGPEQDRLKKMAKSSKNIKFLGFVKKRELKKLYQGCRALIFPQEEDFGLTPLEAMASGRPVIAYRKGGILETLRENISGIFFNKQNPASLKKAIACYNRIEKKFNPHEIRHSVIKFDEENFKRRFKQIISDKFSATN